MPTTPKKTLAVIDDDTELRDELARRFGAGYSRHHQPRRPGHPAHAAGRSPVGCRPRPRPHRASTRFELLRLMAGDPALRGTPVLVALLGQRLRHLRARPPAGAAGVRHQAVLAGRPAAQARGAGQRPQATHQRPPQARRPARQQRPRHAGSSWTAPSRARSDGGGRLGEVLVSEGLVTEQDIVTAVAGQMHIGVVDLTQTTPQPAALGLLPRDFIVRHRLMPLSVDDNGGLSWR